MTSSSDDKGPLLGRQVSGSTHYDPSLLFAVPRDNARRSLLAAQFTGFGEDVWHCYELNWLDADGMPQVWLGTLSVPASSPSLVESKSLKLYLNSLNSHRFADAEAARKTIQSDLSTVVSARVQVSLWPVESGDFRGVSLDGDCLDAISVAVPATADSKLLQRRDGDSRVYSHLMRSLCPVTAQPDWATVVIETRGTQADRAGLLAYLLGYRNHQEFHEHCVERIYSDLFQALRPQFLSVQALYTRRGGLDICPWRCSENLPAPMFRLNRQ